MGWGRKWCVHSFRLLVIDDAVDNERNRNSSYDLVRRSFVDNGEGSVV